jgi:hypothetical protein
MTTLRSQLTALAQSLADAVLAAIKGSSLQEFLGERKAGMGRSGRPTATGREHRAARSRPGRQKPGSKVRSVPSASTDGQDGETRGPHGRPKPGRLRRRSPEEIAKAVDLVAKLVKSHPKGLRSEEIRKKLGLDVREVPRILREGVAAKRLRSKGQKRATTYFAA